MNILCLDQFAQVGGAQRCLLDLLLAFRRRQWRIQLAVPGTGVFAETARSVGVAVKHLPPCSLSKIQKSMGESWNYTRWCLKISRMFACEGAVFEPSLVYVNGPRLLPAAAYFARKNRIPLIFHAHSRILQRTALSLTGLSLKYSRAHVVACCRYVADSLRQYVPANRLKVIYNGVSNLHDSSRFALKPIRVIGVIGRIEPEKGQLDFIRAARIVHQTFPHCRFLVVGSPLLSASDAYVQQLLEESRDLPFRFLPWQDSIWGALSQIDLLVVPSAWFDATPRVISEAFSAGVPVIAFACGGIPEMVQDNVTGFLVHTRSAEALANRMLDVLADDGNTTRQVVLNARRAWGDRFRLEIYQQEICETVLGILRASAASQSHRNQNTPAGACNIG